MDKFQAMKTFVQIVETGSLTAAANALDTSLPTVVRALAALERQLGVSLLKLGMFLSYMVAPNRKGGQLEYVLEKFETEPMQVQVVYPQSKLLSSKVRAFVDECVSKLRRVGFD